MKKKVVKTKKMTVDDLAIIVANGFESLENRLNNKMDTRFDEIDQKIQQLDQNIQATRRDLSNMGDKFVSQSNFDQLVVRVSKLEKKK